MKSAEEMLNERIDKSGFDYDVAIIAMKAYASQAIDRCEIAANTAAIKYRHDIVLSGNIREAIRNVKQELK